MGRVIASVCSCLILLTACGGRSTRTAPERAEGSSPAAKDAGAPISIDERIAPDDQPPPSPEEIEEACDALARVMCARREDCASPSTYGARHISEDDCRARTKLACTDWVILPRTQITLKTIAPCVETIRTASCRNIDTLFYTPTGDLPYCLPSGKAPSAAPCVNDAQCESRYCGPPLDPGFSGETLERDCLECTVAAPTDILRLGYDGDVCDERTGCVDYLTCEAGHCTRLECEGESCLDERAYCSIDEAPYCELGTDCWPDQNGEGHCLGYAKDGEPCGVDDDYGPVCEYPATCVRGLCRLSHQRDCPKATTLTDQLGPR